MQIKVNIKTRMAQAGIRGRQLAPLLNITEPNVSLLINGKSKSISYKQMAALCQILNCQPNDLFELVRP